MIDSLERAKNDIQQGWDTPTGATCACCGQLVKLYKRNLYYKPARSLIELYLLDCTEPGYHHIRNLKPDLGGSDFSKLKYWELISHAANDDPEKHNSGMWAITPKGRLFVEDKIKVPKYAFVFNDSLEEFGGPEIGIRDALAGKFSYPELMGYLL